MAVNSILHLSITFYIFSLHNEPSVKKSVSSTKAIASVCY